MPRGGEGLNVVLYSVVGSLELFDPYRSHPLSFPLLLPLLHLFYIIVQLSNLLLYHFANKVSSVIK